MYQYTYIYIYIEELAFQKGPREQNLMRCLGVESKWEERKSRTN